MFTRVCALDECDVEFQTDNPRKTHCCHEHANRAAVRSWRAKHRKKGGGGPGGNGGGNGGGSSPSLFDSIVPVSSDAFVPVPVIGPSESEQRRKPAHRVNARTNRRANLKARKSPKAAA